MPSRPPASSRRAPAPSPRGRRAGAVATGPAGPPVARLEGRVDHRRVSLHLAAACPVLGGLVERHGPWHLGPRPRPTERFATLANAIVSQQLAGRAAAAIWSRVVDAVGEPVTADAVLGTDPAALRAAGLSGAKAASIVDLAARVADGRLDLEGLGRRSDDEMKAALVTVRGVGPWTADMFSMFALGRLDVWPVGDLGVRQGFGLAYRLGAAPAPAALATMADRFRPYRSVVAWYCWRAVEERRENRPV